MCLGPACRKARGNNCKKTHEIMMKKSLCTSSTSPAGKGVAYFAVSKALGGKKTSLSIGKNVIAVQRCKQADNCQSESPLSAAKARSPSCGFAASAHAMTASCTMTAAPSAPAALDGVLVAEELEVSATPMSAQ